jgi:DNA-binding MarR family transcriptional regulator
VTRRCSSRDRQQTARLLRLKGLDGVAVLVSPLDSTSGYAHIGAMSPRPVPSYRTAEMIGNSCLCLRVQRASRAIGRRFDVAFRSIGLNNWQFSLLMNLHRPSPPTVNGLAEELGMDRTTTTKNLRPLERRRLLEIRQDEDDARVRRIVLTNAGRALLAEAVEHWHAAQEAVTAHLKDADLGSLHAALETIARV